jgi:hypothetical protein
VANERRVLFRWLSATTAVASFFLSSAVARQIDGRDLDVERLAFNLLANSALTSRATDGDVPIPQWLTIAGASNTTPIEVRTPIPHGYATGDQVLVKGVQGNGAANGWWKVTATGETTFTLDGSAGVAEYTGGGSVFPAAGQPPPPDARNRSGDLLWTPWFSAPAVARETEFFQPTGEVYTLPSVPPVSSFLSQEVDGSLLRPGQGLCLSIEARMPEAPPGNQRLKLLVTAALGTVRVHSVTFPANLLTPDYQRFALCFRLADGAITEGGVLRVEFIDENLRGIPRPMYWRRPMLNEGLAPAPWTPETGPKTRTHPFY